MFGQIAEQKALYDELDADLRARVVEAVGERNDALERTIEAKRDILARAFFVLLFGQFEAEVNRKFEAELASRSASPDWTRRRGWDAASLKGKKVPFETRLSMILDRNLPTFGKIDKTYSTRNHCAHGGTKLAVGSIESLVQDIYGWYAEIR